MILPTACINWAALRSGLSLPDFMASLDSEREEEILKSYNAWRKSKGLPEVRPCVPKPLVAPKPAASASVAVVQPLTQGEDREPQGENEPQDDDISSLVSKIADQVAREELEDAELIQEAWRLPEERIPRELEEELTATAPSEVAAIAPSEVAATAPQESPATEQDSSATAPSEVLATEQQSPTTAPQVEPDGPIMESDVSERFLTIARTLPKVADPAMYEGILSKLADPLDVVKSLAEETRKLYTAMHRSTVGLRAFIEWLSKDFHHTAEQ